MLKKIAHALTRRPKLVVFIAVLLMIPSFIGAAATKVNYDLLTYLPPETNSSKGEKLLEEPFHNAATSMLIVQNMPPAYTNNLRKSIEKIPGVTHALWISSMAGIQVPKDMIPEKIRKAFYSGNSTMMVIQFQSPGHSKNTHDLQ